MREDIEAALENARQFDNSRGKRDATRLRMLLAAFLRDVPDDMTVRELREELEDN